MKNWINWIKTNDISWVQSQERLQYVITKINNKINNQQNARFPEKKQIFSTFSDIKAEIFIFH